MLYGLIGLAAIFSQFADRYKDFHFLAGGETLAKLQKARTGYELQQAVLADVKARFNVSDVCLASDTELKYWPEMKEARGFKVYFEKGAQPEGWSIPEHWGNRQHHWNTFVYLPGKGSEDQAFLDKAAEKLKDIQKTYGQPERNRGYSSGWYSWEGDVFPKRDTTIYAKRIVPDVYIITVRDFIEKKRPDYEPAGSVSITAADAKMLESNPDKAARRAKYLQNDQSLLRAYEKISYKLGF
jgi:hypothetical protein